jgi:hypothetical protein
VCTIGLSAEIIIVKRRNIKEKKLLAYLSGIYYNENSYVNHEMQRGISYEKDKFQGSSI